MMGAADSGTRGTRGDPTRDLGICRDRVRNDRYCFGLASRVTYNTQNEATGLCVVLVRTRHIRHSYRLPDKRSLVIANYSVDQHLILLEPNWNPGPKHIPVVSFTANGLHSLRLACYLCHIRS
jgi:hypothetical protein